MEPHVAAAAVEDLTPRLRKKLDAAVERCTGLPVTADGQAVRVSWGEDAVVTLEPGPSGAITDPGAARCSCLLAPRCLHRAAVLSTCPIADPGADTGTDTDPDPGSGLGAEPEPAARTDGGTGPDATDGETVTTGGEPTAAQVAAAAELWGAAAAVLVGGVTGAGAVPQAELLRAAHTARLAGLPRAEAEALRVVRGLQAARAHHDGHRLTDLVSALGELLLTTGRLAAADPDPALVGTVRRAYRQGDGLRVHGVCREPVISATGYAGVVTHLVAEDGRWFSVADVRPGGPARACAAATAVVALGAAALNHAQLARGGLLISGTTISADGRLGAGRSVRANPVAGLPWSAGPLAALFARPLGEVADERLSGNIWNGAAEGPGQPVGCDLVIVGAEGDRVLARELPPMAGPEGPLIRLVAADSHPDLAHVANLRRLASRPGLRVRVIGRLDPSRASTLRPLAVGPVPGAEPTLRLPAEWLGRADLGYDRLQGSHLPSRDACPPEQGSAGADTDPLAGSPLWRVRRLVELAVSGGRWAVAESARGGDLLAQRGPLRRAGFETAAELITELTAEAGRRARDVFGRLVDADGDRYARAWLAAVVHLEATERALVQASWHGGHAP
ncbi:hypothetical protein FHR32_008308 [Streptosporangium album]|uniref:SWIM-type domain-containing protein n=1 Tax=Streptosporangium album TaxID=47479 RepID=A0A7W7S559_9ACTN|nr:SWIM zinc finger family protein [Streptosporangium album]MBB4943907.1 hypothetical protein [Streptosporangium album]